jgi:hypothetical protein
MLPTSDYRINGGGETIFPDAPAAFQATQKVGDSLSLRSSEPNQRGLQVTEFKNHNNPSFTA